MVSFSRGAGFEYGPLAELLRHGWDWLDARMAAAARFAGRAGFERPWSGAPSVGRGPSLASLGFYCPCPAALGGSLALALASGLQKACMADAPRNRSRHYPGAHARLPASQTQSKSPGCPKV